LANGSHLIRVGEEWFDERNPEHDEQRREAEKVLREAGFLKRRLNAT
jgi:hypothetical protein